MHNMLDFKTFFNNHSSIILLIESDTGKILDANPSALKFYQYTKEEITNLTIFDINQLPVDEVKNLIALASLKIEEHFYFPHKLKNGEIRYIEAFTSKYKVDNKEIFVSIYSDATEKALKEKELETEKKRFELFVKSSPTWINFTNKGGKIFYSSDAIKEITGYTLDDIKGSRELLISKMPVEYQKIAKKHVEEVENEDYKGVASFEFKFTTKNGKEKWLKHTCKSIFDEKGDYVGRIAIFDDITELKTVIERLKNEKVRLEYILESANIGTWTWNIQTDKAEVDRRWLQILGYELKELEPININALRTLCHTEDLKVFEDIVNRHLKGELDNIECSARVRCSDGRYIWTLIKGKVIEYDNEGNPKTIFGILIDINDLKKLEEKLKRYLYFLNRAQEVTTTGCWSLNIKTGKIWWSKETYNIFNVLKDKDVTLQDFFSFVHPEDREYVSDAWNKALNGEKYDIVHKVIVDDKVKYVHEKGEVFFNEKNEPIEAFGTVQDITERHLLEMEIERENKIINKIIGLLPGYFWTVDKDRNITKINENTRQRFNCKTGEKCFLSIWKGKFLNKDHKKLIEEEGIIPPDAKCEQGIIPPDAKCEHCMADVALEKQEPVVSELEYNKSFYKVWWIPVNNNEYIHYLVDITKEKQKEKELYDISITDPLTKTYNRHYTSKRIEHEIELCKRTGRRFSLIMFDIDNFKDINDNYGHNIGDIVLQEIVAVVSKRIRKADVLGRWGGEEFLILLPETSLLSAAFLADELREKTERANIANLSVTASFGVTEYHSEDTLFSIIERVDKFMYNAKKKGRNRVEAE